MNRFLSRYEEQAGRPIQRIDVPVVIRLNTLKIPSEDILGRLAFKGVRLRKISYLRSGYELIEAPFSLGATPEYLQGYYYLQNAASQISVQLLDPQPGELILDMCASPGSKTTQMAQHMENTGIITALDATAVRLAKLRNNVQRMGVTNTVILHKDGREATSLGMRFDRVLLDAPCSGNFISDERWFEKRDISGVRKNAALQRQLLLAACDCLKEGGLLVYSTCSLEVEEDEEVVAWGLENLPLQLIPASFPYPAPALQRSDDMEFPPSMQHALRFWPDILKSEGFFVALFRKVPTNP